MHCTKAGLACYLAKGKYSAGFSESLWAMVIQLAVALDHGAVGATSCSAAKHRGRESKQLILFHSIRGGEG